MVFEHVFQPVRGKTPFGDKINRKAEGFFKLFTHPPKTEAKFDIGPQAKHQINITVGPRLAPGPGPEERQPADPMPAAKG